MGRILIDSELAREALGQAGCLRVAVRGGSMGPWIVSGDSIVIEAVRPEQVCVGEILVYEARGSLIAHRAERREHGTWITRGDSADRSDLPIEDDQIVGRVRGLHMRWVQLDDPPPKLRCLLGRVILRVSPHLNRARRWIRR